jgi:hypothetical protein
VSDRVTERYTKVGAGIRAPVPHDANYKRNDRMDSFAGMLWIMHQRSMLPMGTTQSRKFADH